MNDTLKATDIRVRKGRWIYLADHPRGWFLITYRNPQLDAEGRVHIAVNNRGRRTTSGLPPAQTCWSAAMPWRVDQVRQS